jgi:hypothetical protein
MALAAARCTGDQKLIVLVAFCEGFTVEWMFDTNAASLPVLLTMLFV